MTTIGLFLSPEQLFAIPHGGPFHATSQTTSTQKWKLTGLWRTILISEVSTLELRISGHRRNLVQTELMNAVGTSEGQKSEDERKELHVGGAGSTSCLAQFET
jgi:hypothetical protein